MKGLFLGALVALLFLGGLIVSTEVEHWLADRKKRRTQKADAD